jgi:hypothetical protein
MSHLASRLSALVDGQLSPDEAERALMHVAGCAECAAELAAARSARRALSEAIDVPMAPDLTARLLALGIPSAAPGEPAHRGPSAITVRATSRRVDFAAGSVPLPGAVSAGAHGGPLSGQVTARRRVPGRWLVAATAGVGAVVVALAGLGELPEVTPSPSPAQALTVLGTAEAPTPRELHPPERTAVRTAVSSGSSTAASSRAAVQRAVLAWEVPRGPGAGAGDGGTVAAAPDGDSLDGWLESHGWSAPHPLPAGYSVSGLRADLDAGVEVDLVGGRGLIVLTLTRGHLSPDAVRHDSRVQTEEGTVHVLSSAPWHAVWQSGDTVVDVVAEEPSDAMNAFVEAYPPRAADDGVGARIARGWRTVAGAWGP